MKQDHNSPEYQRAVDNFVRQNVLCCVSSLVATLAEGAARCDWRSWQEGSRKQHVKALSDLAEQACELSSPVLDYEEAARQAGWEKAPAHVKRPGTWWREATATENGKRPPIQETADAACQYDNLAPYKWEIFEHWAVTEWLAEKLEAKGERIDRDFAGLCVWGRTCTGQAISMDGVICDIYDEMMGAV